MKTVKTALSIVIISAIVFAFNFPAETYNVDTDASELKWTGYHLAKSYEHWGNIKIKSGSLTLEGDKIVSGEFIIDMNTITNGDLEDAKDNKKLVGHLKSKDFFAADKFPEAKLAIKSAENSGDDYKVTADLTIRGITKEISFGASKTSSGNSIVFNADMKINRTDHEVMYGWKLENAILSDEFRLEIKLVASK